MRFIPPPDVLKRVHGECQSDEVFLRKIVGKSEILSGSKESLEYLDMVYEKIKSNNESKSVAR